MIRGLEAETLYELRFAKDDKNWTASLQARTCSIDPNVRTEADRMMGIASASPLKVPSTPGEALCKIFIDAFPDNVVSLTPLLATIPPAVDDRLIEAVRTAFGGGVSGAVEKRLPVMLQPHVVGLSSAIQQTKAADPLSLHELSIKVQETLETLAKLNATSATFAQLSLSLKQLSSTFDSEATAKSSEAAVLAAKITALPTEAVSRTTAAGESSHSLDQKLTAVDQELEDLQKQLNEITKRLEEKRGEQARLKELKAANDRTLGLLPQAIEFAQRELKRHADISQSNVGDLNRNKNFAKTLEESIPSLQEMVAVSMQSSWSQIAYEQCAVYKLALEATTKGKKVLDEALNDKLKGLDWLSDRKKRLQEEANGVRNVSSLEGHLETTQKLIAETDLEILSFRQSIEDFTKLQEIFVRDLAASEAGFRKMDEALKEVQGSKTRPSPMKALAA